MSELKAYTLFTTSSLSGQRVYLANEADAVIAELKAENERLKNEPCNDGEKCNAYWELHAEKEKLKQEKDKWKAEAERWFDRYTSTEAFKKLAIAEDENRILNDVVGGGDIINADLSIELRATRRALWLARADRAEAEARGWYHSTGYCVKYDGGHTIKGAFKGKGLLRFPDEWFKMWLKVERKCRAKAEEYK